MPLDDARDDGELLHGKQILATCPHLDATYRHHQRLNAWMTVRRLFLALSGRAQNGSNAPSGSR